MIKVIGLLSRKDGMTHTQFVRHWVDIHAPMADTIPGLRRYVQSVVVGEPLRADGAMLTIDGGPVDGIAELWFDDLAAYERMKASPEGKRWHADAALFIARSKAFVLEENTIIPTG